MPQGRGTTTQKGVVEIIIPFKTKASQLQLFFDQFDLQLVIILQKAQQCVIQKLTVFFTKSLFERSECVNGINSRIKMKDFKIKICNCCEKYIKLLLLLISTFSNLERITVSKISLYNTDLFLQYTDLKDSFWGLFHGNLIYTFRLSLQTGLDNQFVHYFLAIKQHSNIV